MPHEWVSSTELVGAVKLHYGEKSNKLFAFYYATYLQYQS